MWLWSNLIVRQLPTRSGSTSAPRAVTHSIGFLPILSKNVSRLKEGLSREPCLTRASASSVQAPELDGNSSLTATQSRRRVWIFFWRQHRLLARLGHGSW